MDFSILLYLLTFLFGLYIDNSTSATFQNKKVRCVYIVWLYIFLCFGYMTGSDWRSYELNFNDIKWTDLSYIEIEKGFYFVFWLIKQVIPDFWLALGLMKCLYLSSLIKLFKKITPYYLSSIALFMPINLTFILIDNPLRFMVALIFVNIGILYLIDKKYWKSLLFLLLSVLFHETSIFFLILPLCFIFTNYICKVKKVILMIIYLIIYLMSFYIDNLNALFYFIVDETSLVSANKFESYQMNNNNVFSVGIIIKILFFCFVLFYKSTIIKMNNGKYIYSMLLLYFYLDRFFSFLATGFRLLIPMTYFYAIFIAYLIVKKKIVGYFFIIYYFLAFSVNIWTSWKMIPYTNSIPYIIMGHKPYIERSKYNIIEYQERTGKIVDREY